MGIQIGAKAQVSIGFESTPGTAVSTTVATRISSTGIQRKATHEALKTLSGDGTVAIASDSFLSTIDIDGPIKGPAGYQGSALGSLLELAMGAKSTSGSGPYDHAFTLAQSQLTATLAVERGSLGGLGDEVVNGCKLNRLTLSCDTGKAMEFEASFLGMGGADRTGSSPTALATLYPVIHSHAGQMSFNSANYKLSKFKLTIDRKLQRVDELGSAYSAEPMASDDLEVSLDLELVARSDDLLAANLAGTQSDAAITFSDGTRSLAITLHNAKIVQYSDPISSVGVVTQQVTLRGHGDGTKHGLGITLTNGNSSSRGS